MRETPRQYVHIYIHIFFILCEYLVMRLAGYVAVWERVEVYTGCWWGNLRERNHLDDPGINGRIILRWIFRRWDVVAWTGSNWLRVGGGHL
jgi:hypothetical protein